MVDLKVKIKIYAYITYIKYTSKNKYIKYILKTQFIYWKYWTCPGILSLRLEKL